MAARTRAEDDASAAVLLTEYLRASDGHRDTATVRTWSAMSTRQQSLFREAAVIGYVAGVLAAGGRGSDIPTDTVIVQRAIQSGSAEPELYPTIGRIAGRARRRHQRQLAEESDRG